MIERVLLALFIGAVAFSLYHLLLWVQRRRAGLNAAPHVASQPAESGHAKLLYFRSKQCGTCAAQALYLDQLDAPHRALIQPIDAVQQPDVARQYSVMTLPTTIVVDNQGRVRHINPGLTNPFKLTRQLDALHKR